MTAPDRLARHAIETRFEDLPADALAQAKTFILDTIGVGVAGSSAGGMAQLHSAASRWGAGDEAALWGRRARAPAPAAALLNGFAAHCQEYDCVHEGAVLHPMATLLPAVLAFADRAGGVSGQALLTAVAVGVDVAVSLGVAAKTGLRFFRPATAGGFGATAAIGRLMGFGPASLVGAFGLQYAQASGTMQPHVEGNIALPMQVGFNSRAALQSCDLTFAGIAGPRDVFEGPFGYMRLFEGEWDLAPALAALGTRWRVAEMSHKPYPAGRATHGGVEGILALQARHGFGAEEVEQLCVVGPPLISRLCGRPDLPAPTPSYARLCMAFVGAKVLQHGRIDLAHYRGDALTDPTTHALASRIVMIDDGTPDPNALTPQRVVVRLKSGAEHEWRCTAMLAAPDRRLSREQHLAKFRRCWEFAADTLSATAAETLVAMVDSLEHLDDTRRLTRLLAP